jgi:beta-galactosidase
MKKLISSALLLAVSGASTLAQREFVELSTGWKFTKAEAAPDAAFDSWQMVEVPHTWNAFDGQDGKAAEPDLPDGYYRGPAWYARTIEAPTAWKSKRVFIRFEAASLVADIWLNGKKVGEHRGGFTAFCFELTPYLKFGGQNVLRVRVDNSRRQDVPPLRGDFTVCGGIYRPVRLLVTDQTCITPLDFASPGIYLTQKEVSASQAVAETEIKLSSALPHPVAARVEVEVQDEKGEMVSKAQSQIELPATNSVAVKQNLSIAKPHLWNGRADPYLYSVTVRLVRDGVVVDQVAQPLGLRTVQVDAKLGFLLNGKPYAIRGVNRHQERRDKGWALSPADHEEDHRMILDIGATALRLAHYPQSDYFASLCDHSGLLLWEEIPLVDTVRNTPEFHDNIRQQLLEMIHQGYNHPAICFWGLFNELYMDSTTDPPEPLVSELKQLAKSIDSSRPNVAATCKLERTNLNVLPDWVAFNFYPYWYAAYPKDFAGSAEERSLSVGGKRIAVSEYGAGASIRQHEEGEVKKPKTNGPWHPEEWQAIVHERDWAQAKANPSLWGTFLWVMFDFASDARKEGDLLGINDKGLVTQDRKVKKDAFFFYQANWTTNAMVHIASKRMTPRKLANTEIKVYSNCDSVELKLNGKSLGSVRPDDIKICRWKNVQLEPGNNRLECIGLTSGCKVTDDCDWVLE